MLANSDLLIYDIIQQSSSWFIRVTYTATTEKYPVYFGNDSRRFQLLFLPFYSPPAPLMYVKQSNALLNSEGHHVVIMST